MSKCITHVHEYAAYLDDLRDRLDDENTIVKYLQELWDSMVVDTYRWTTPPSSVLIDALRAYGPETAEYAIRAAAKACIGGSYDSNRARLSAYFLGICRRHDDGR